MPSPAHNVTPSSPTLPLVLLPGTLCDERLFAPLQKRLPGIATSVFIGAAARTLEQAANELLDFMPGQFALLGFSLGGMIAMEAALRAPERVRGLFLLSTTPLPVSPGDHAFRRDIVAQAHKLGIAACLHQQLWPSYTDRADDSTHLALFTAMSTSLGAETFARQTEMALARTDFRPRLRALRCPTFVLAGEDDKLCPPDVQQALLAALPSGALTLLRKAGHLALLEEADEVASHVAAWFHLIQAHSKEME